MKHHRATSASVVFIAAFLFAWVASVLRAIQMHDKGGDAYRVGDWLINYEGGFVRRGLVGQLFFWGGRSLPGTLLPSVLVVQVALYAILLVWGGRLLRPHLASRASILLLALSPATFLFEALNPQSFRKELLGLCVLAVFCHSVRASRRRVHRWLGYLSVIMPGLILSHEAMLVLLPYFIMVALPEGSSRSLSRGARVALGVVIVSSLIAFTAALLAPGDRQTVRDIFESLRGLIPQSSLTRRGSHGSIQALQHSASRAFSDLQVRFSAQGYNYPLKYALILGLSMLPFLVNQDHLTRLWSRTSHRWLLACAATLTFGLCLIAKDWGRFIYMNATALTLVLLSRPPLSPSQSTVWTRMLVPLSLIYACVWRVPISTPSLEEGGFVQTEAVMP